jgi:hypothetical protein
MAHVPDSHQLSTETSLALAADAAKRFNSLQDPYEDLVTDGNFRKALLKGNDVQIIVAGTALQVGIDIQNRLNGNHKSRRSKIKDTAVPIIGWGAVFTAIVAIVNAAGGI